LEAVRDRELQPGQIGAHKGNEPGGNGAAEPPSPKKKEIERCSEPSPRNQPKNETLAYVPRTTLKKNSLRNIK